jgi:hypothetical protein
MSMSEQQTSALKRGDWVRVPAGQGYWDVTTYPYGGCFRRAAKDWQAMVAEVGVGRHGREATLVVRSLGHMPDSRYVVAMDVLVVTCAVEG